MLEQLQQLVRESCGQMIEGNTSIPAGKVDDVVKEAADSIVAELKQQVSQGNVSAVKELWTTRHDEFKENHVVKQIQGRFIERLVSKTGLQTATAEDLAQSLIPAVLKKFVSKSNKVGDHPFELTKVLADLSDTRMLGGSEILGAKEDHKDRGTLGNVKGLS